MLELISTPEKTIEGIVSNVNGARSQLPYTFQRKDFDSGNITNLAGYAQVYIFLGLADSFNIGDTIYLSEPNKYEGFHTVKSWNSGTLQLELNTPYIGDETSIYVNNITERPNYKVLITIRDGNDDSIFLINQPFSYSPDPSGKLFLDLGSLLTELHEELEQLSIEYLIRLEETYTGKPVENYPDYTASSPASSNVGGLVQINALSADTGILSAGDIIYCSFSTTYTSGNYSINQVVDSATIILDLAYNTGSVGCNISPATAPIITTPTIQSIYAEKQLLDIGGSNMYEYLLRSGLPLDSPYLGGEDLSDLNPVETDNSSKIWDTVNNEELLFQFTGAGDQASNEIALISQFVDNPIYPKGSLIRYNFTFVYDVSSFVTTGNLRLDFILRNSAGSNVAIFNNTYASPTADQGYQEVTIEGTYIIPEDGMSRLRIRLNRFGGDFTSHWDIKTSLPPRNITLEVSTVGKLLTTFKNPLYWKGYSRLVNVVNDKYLIDRTGANRSTYTGFGLDINKLGNTNAYNGGLPDTVGVHQQDLDIIYQNLSNVSTPVRYLGFYTQIEYDANTQTSEQLDYQVLEPCDNPVYIGWVSSKGGFEQHLFSYNQLVERTVEQGLLAESVINQDIEVVKRTKKRLPNIWTEQIILTAEGLTLDQLKALQEIKQSDYVVLYLTKDLSKEVFVIVSNGYSQQYDTRSNLYDYSIQVELPDNFDFFKAKEY